MPQVPISSRPLAFQAAFHDISVVEVIHDDSVTKDARRPAHRRNNMAWISWNNAAWACRAKEGHDVMVLVAALREPHHLEAGVTPEAAYIRDLQCNGACMCVLSRIRVTLQSNTVDPMHEETCSSIRACHCHVMHRMT